MPDYREMYFALAARVADAVELLTEAQQEGEERFVEAPSPNLLMLDGEPISEQENKRPAEG